MVPEGWKLTELGSLGAWSGGGTPNKANKAFWEGGTIPWVSPKDMWTTSVDRTQDYITEDAVKNSSTKVYPPGSIFIVTRSGILRKRVPVAISTVFAAVNQDIKVLSPNINIDTTYVANFLWCFNDIVLSRCAKDGTTVESIDTNSLMGFPIKLPPIQIQEKIAQILSTWDKAITTTEQLLANSQRQKKALMQQLLTGKKRLLDEYGVRFSGDWKSVKLGSVADMNSGGTPKSNVDDYYGGEIPWVSIADMTKHGKWIVSTEKYLTAQGLENSSARIYPKNSVLYAMYASIGECSIAKVPLSSSQAILGIRPKAPLNFEFLYFFLVSLKQKIKLQGQQGTQSNLNAGMVKNFVLHLPNLDEQQKIARVLSRADDEINTLQQKLEALKQEKKALMQQLLTGKRRVKVDEEAA